MKKYFICFVLIIFAACKNNESTNKINEQININNISIIENKFKFLAPICKKDTNDNTSEYLFRVGCLTDLGKGKLGVLDMIKSQILVISTENGKILKRVGQKGGGPGEFMGVYNLKNTKGHGVSVLDLMQRKLVFFNEELKYVKDVKIKQLLDDYIIVNDTTWYVSNFLLTTDYKPICKFNPITEKYSKAFGRIVEPQNNIIKKVSQSPFKGSDISLFSYGWMTNILLMPDGKNIIYSQLNPYTLIKYNCETQKGEAFNITAPFSTENKLEYEVKGESRTTKLGLSGNARAPFIYNKYIVVPITSADLKNCFLDFYNMDYTFDKRYRLPKFPDNVKTTGNFILKDHVLYIAVSDKDGITWIERMLYEE